MRRWNTRFLIPFTTGCLLREQEAGGGGVRDAKQPQPVNFVHIKRIVLACYEARLKFQNVVVIGDPL